MSLKNSTRRRSDTTKNEYSRSPERLFRQEGQWYFQTREGDRGPHDTREGAELRLDRYVETMGFFEDKPWLRSDVDLSDVTIVDMEKPDCYSG